jgi:hypothetical protein
MPAASSVFSTQILLGCATLRRHRVRPMVAASTRREQSVALELSRHRGRRNRRGDARVASSWLHVRGDDRRRHVLALMLAALSVRTARRRHFGEMNCLQGSATSAGRAVGRAIPASLRAGCSPRATGTSGSGSFAPTSPYGRAGSPYLRSLHWRSLFRSPRSSASAFLEL